MTTTATKNAMPTLSEPHPTLQIYNTLSKQKEPFRTVVPGKVGIYLCGPTVYDKAHIGHMVGPVIFDCIKRYLVYCGYDVEWVVNITDVDDKLINKANERGISMLEVAEENIKDYNDNLAALGVDQIDHFPRATDCMDEIIRFVESLVEQGFAYESSGDVYFEVGKDHQYGKLSNRSVDAMQGEGGGTAQRKRGLADFALWKSAKPEEPSWESPWGKGRPVCISKTFRKRSLISFRLSAERPTSSVTCACSLTASNSLSKSSSGTFMATLPKSWMKRR